MKFSMPYFKFPPAGGGRRFSRRNLFGFTLIEIMVVVSLLSLIVLALMAVFSSTQRAFRSGVTQTDVLEGGRAAVDLIASDLHGITPSGGVAAITNMNFLVANNASYSTPLVQPLPGSTVSRTNLLQQLFILNRQNTKWWGVGYAVASNSPDGLFALYRMEFPSGGIVNGTNNPTAIYSAITNFFASPSIETTNISHLINGVVNFSVRAYDQNGTWINAANAGYLAYTNFVQTTNTTIVSIQGGEAGLAMYSNVVPAAVELNLAVVEDRALARAQSFPTFASQTNYLSQQAGAVHVFRQRVIIPNVDRTAYYSTNQ